jgi:tetratricopeptide (TPR) repeat protein
MKKGFAVAGSCALAISACGIARAGESADASRDARAECQALTAQGRRKEAVLACSRALETVRSPENVRALVSALVDGPTPPTSQDLALALQIAGAQRDRGENLTASAAACDIAERMGDMVMLERCTDELLATAPSDPTTVRAKAALDAASPPWRFWAAWGVMAIGLGATAADALARRKKRRVSATIATAAGVVSAMLLVGPLAHAEEPSPTPTKGWLSKWPIDDKDPEKSIPVEKERNADPLNFGYWLQDVTWKAETYAKRGDHMNAARYYKVLGVAVPDRAIGYIKACDEYEAAGDREQAIEACGQALLRDGTLVRDYLHFVDLVLGEPGAITDKQRAALAQVVAHMREDTAARDVVDDTECRVGVRTSNVAQLKECTTALAARVPDDPRTIMYLWAYAVARGDSGAAQALVARARTAGVPDKDLGEMTKTTEHALWMGRLRVAIWVVAAGLLAAAAVLLARSLKPRRRVEAASPSV